MDEMLKTTLIILECWLEKMEKKQNWNMEDFNKVTEVRSIVKKLKNI